MVLYLKTRRYPGLTCPPPPRPPAPPPPVRLPVWFGAVSARGPPPSRAVQPFWPFHRPLLFQRFHPASTPPLSDLGFCYYHRWRFLHYHSCRQRFHVLSAAATWAPLSLVVTVVRLSLEVWSEWKLAGLAPVTGRLEN